MATTVGGSARARAVCGGRIAIHTSVGITCLVAEDCPGYVFDGGVLLRGGKPNIDNEDHFGLSGASGTLYATDHYSTYTSLTVDNTGSEPFDTAYSNILTAYHPEWDPDPSSATTHH